MQNCSNMVYMEYQLIIDMRNKNGIIDAEKREIPAKIRECPLQWKCTTVNEFWNATNCFLKTLNDEMEVLTMKKTLIATLLSVVLLLVCATSVAENAATNQASLQEQAELTIVGEVEIDFDKIYGASQTVYGFYDPMKTRWKINPAFKGSDDQTIAPEYPPEDSLCLIACYQNDRLSGYRAISPKAFWISLPTRLKGIEQFDEEYGRYKAYGFENYSYSGKNVRGFYDPQEHIFLLNFNPVDGTLFAFDDDAEFGTFLVAEYENDTLCGIKEVTEAEFCAIPGVEEQAARIKAKNWDS